MNRLPKQVLVVGLVSFMSMAASVAFAQPSPKNIVLIVLDDFNWSDLPFINNPPLKWDSSACDPASPNFEACKRSLRLRHPDLNRFVARTLANCDETGCRAGDYPAELGGNGTSEKVVPVDVDVASELTASPFAYTSPTAGRCSENCDYVKGLNREINHNLEHNQSGADGPSGCATEMVPGSSPPVYRLAACRPNKDLLPEYGGLNRLARDGISFTRFYAASALCQPTRASILSGRYQGRTGVPSRNATGLSANHVTIGEFLQQGCDGAKAITCDRNRPPTDPSSCAALKCYRTGLIGKWGVGDSSGMRPDLREQGFDEFIGFGGHSRDYDTTSKLKCSASRLCDDGMTCASNADCSALTCISGQCPNGRSCTGDGECQRCELSPLYLGPAGGPDAFGGGYPCDSVVNPSTNKTRNAEHPTLCCSLSKSGSDVYPEPSVSLEASRFDFGAATNHWLADGKTFPGQGGQKQYKCSNTSADVDVTGCPYSTRHYGDLAADFIKRHYHDNDGRPGDTWRFFLMLSFHATHSAHKAPYRTTAHYRTEAVDQVQEKNMEPNADYWPVVEEADAAIGKVLAAVDTSNTVVILLSDQGAPGGAYGDPVLDGGKKNVREGGVRVPLIIYGLNGHGLNSVPYQSDLNDPNPTLGSQADLLFTIATLAGMPVPLVGDSKIPSPDNVTTEWPEKWIDGEPLLQIAGNGYQIRDTTRDYVFASFGGQSAVISEQACYAADTAAKVCGYAPVAGDSRTYRAASCYSCQNNSDCSSSWCPALGSVCVSDAECGAGCTTSDCSCRVDTGSVSSLVPCTSNADCTSGERCRHRARIRCAHCIDAMWKYISEDGGHLFDVNSNPSESLGVLSLGIYTDEQTLDCSGAFPNVRNHLECLANLHNNCSSSESSCLGGRACPANAPTVSPTDEDCQ